MEALQHLFTASFYSFIQSKADFIQSKAEAYNIYSPQAHFLLWPGITSPDNFPFVCNVINALEDKVSAAIVSSVSTQ